MMAIATPTISRITTPCGSFAADSGTGGPVRLRALYAAYTACRRGKRQARNTMAYEARALDRLIETRDALNDRSWRPSRTLCFVVDRPKAREIHAADFGDRVVHHWLVPRLERWFEPVFIHDSYSNRKGRGTHAAVDRLQHFVQQATRSGKLKAWYLQLDIANFFNSIDREILYRLIRQRAERVWRAEKAQVAQADRSQSEERHAELNFCLWLCRTLLEHDAGASAIARAPAQALARVPAHKQLKNAPPGVGLPIGNLTSQFFANVYLDRLDQFVKHTLQVRHYLRYVDDFVLLHEDPAQLLRWRDAIVHFLDEHLALRLKVQAEPLPVGGGIDFLGYVTRRTYRLPRRRVLRQAQARLSGFAAALVQPVRAGTVIRWVPRLRNALRASWASTLGHLKQSASQRQAQALWQAHPWARSAFALDARNFQLRQRFEPPSVTSYAGQKRWFARRFPAAAVLVQKGWGYELLDGAASKASAKPGTPTKANARAAANAMHPVARVHRLVERLRRAGRAYVIVREEGYLKRGLKRRTLSEIGWPSPKPPRPLASPILPHHFQAE